MTVWNAHYLLLVQPPDDVVQLNYYIKNVADFRKGADVYKEYFKNDVPARMMVVTEFMGSTCLCQMEE